MSFLEYWGRLISSNESLKEPENKMTISVASFRRQLEKAHTAGVEAGKNQSSGSLFDQLFGGGPFRK